MMDFDEAVRSLVFGPFALPICVIKEQVEACEQRHSNAQKDGSHPCPSYVYCMVGRTHNIWGEGMAYPVCPRKVLQVMQETKKKLEEV